MKNIHPLEAMFEALESNASNPEAVQALIQQAGSLAASWTDAEFIKYNEDLIEFMNQARRLASNLGANR